MRMTKRNKQLLRLYRRERARGFQAEWALSNARTRLEWEKHEVAEHSSGEPIDPKRGNVRLRVVPDDTCSLEDLEGDCFNPKANPHTCNAIARNSSRKRIGKGCGESSASILTERSGNTRTPALDSSATIGNTPATTPTSCKALLTMLTPSVFAVRVVDREYSGKTGRCEPDSDA